MIVVVGSPIGRPLANGIAAGGIPADVAQAVAAAGGSVQIVGRVGEDATGDEVLLALAAAGVEHVAVLRESTHSTPSAPPTPGVSASPDGPDVGESLLTDEGPARDAPDAAEPAGLSMDADDLELALRYLPDYQVVVLAVDLDAARLAAVVAATGWAGAHLVALIAADAGAAGLPSDATVLERPASDPEGAFVRFVAAYAVALDQGRDPRAAFSDASGAGGWAASPS